MPPRKRPRARKPSPDGALERCVNVDEVEALAKKRLRPAYYDYYAGGAGDECTLARNRGGFGHYALLHRVLVNVERVDTATQVLGTQVSMPILVAPTAYHRLADDEGETATARGTGAAGTLMVASTLATRTLEEIAGAATGPLWFQLYVYRDRGITERLIARAEAAGYRALVVTVDTPRLGRRERDVRNRFTLRRGLTVANLAAEGAGLARWEQYGSMAGYASALLDPSLTWDTIAWIRERTRLPIVLKGIARADDAARAVEHGAAGVWVSNHGGRQLDGCEASVLALPAVVAGSAAGPRYSWTEASAAARTSSRRSLWVPVPSWSAALCCGAWPREESAASATCWRCSGRSSPSLFRSPAAPISGPWIQG